jgi:hypothetical protein
MLATFNGAWDWTAVGTLALAAVTLALAGATFWMVKLTRRTLTQNQDEIALSRREVEEAHRPVVVPLTGSRLVEIMGARGGPRPTMGPDVHSHGQLTVPIENVGTGPALHVLAAVRLLDDDGEPSAPGDRVQMPALIAGLKSGGSVAPFILVDNLSTLTSFWLSLMYEDVAGKGWITEARFMKVRGRYEDIVVNEFQLRPR